MDTEESAGNFGLVKTSVLQHLHVSAIKLDTSTVV